MTFKERFNFVPPCLRDDNSLAVTSLDHCVYQSLLHYINLLLVIVAIAAFFYIVYAGIQMATAYGNESKYAQAKHGITNAIIGIIIATLAFVIVTFFTNLLGVNIQLQNIDPVTGIEVNIDPGTGNKVENNPQAVTAAYKIRSLNKPPGNGALSDEELEFVTTDTARGDPTSSGPFTAIYLVSPKEFRAYVKGGDGIVNAVVTKRDDSYVARLGGATSVFRGGELVILQRDDKGTWHKKTVKIN